MTADFPDFAALVSAARERGKSTLALHRLLMTTNQLKKFRILTYRCAQRRCLLLDVFHTPEGIGVYWAPMRLSPGRNAATSSVARVSSTTDGERRWADHADLLTSGFSYTVSCDHVLDQVIEADQILATVASHQGEILI